MKAIMTALVATAALLGPLAAQADEGRDRQRPGKPRCRDGADTLSGGAAPPTSRATIATRSPMDTCPRRANAGRGTRTARPAISRRLSSAEPGVQRARYAASIERSIARS